MTDESDFDRALGEWVFYGQNHSGQGSEFYEKLSELSRRFRPGAAFSETRFFDPRIPDYEGARAVYRELCLEHKIPDPFRVLIAVARDESFAPGCFILCRVKNPEAGPGKYDWDERDEEMTRLIQTDWDFPGVARSFGWDGEDSDIDGAREYLDDCVENAKVIEDPGYFDQED